RVSNHAVRKTYLVGMQTIIRERDAKMGNSLVKKERGNEGSKGFVSGGVEKWQTNRKA
ncbi:hypothetical protein JTE90_016544, partial [Oedothorax gibbosus]